MEASALQSFHFLAKCSLNPKFGALLYEQYHYSFMFHIFAVWLIVM